MSDPALTPEAFIAHWSKAEANERANSQTFLLQLTQMLGVPAPSNNHADGYSFEFPVKVPGTASTNFLDLYRRAHFVLESKQFAALRQEQSELELAAQKAGVIEAKGKSGPVRGTAAWDDAMIRARGQAERYVRYLPADEPTPPFIIVCDVGHSFEVYADFTQAGKAYLPFPDPRSFRIRLTDLANEEVRERLRLIWTNPAALDPAKVSADVTRQIAAYLAELAKSLEQSGHDPEVVAQFLTRCLFCMFAEDVGLLPERCFTELLDSLDKDGTGFVSIVGTLFREMNTGTKGDISVVLRKKLLRFNGGLFADHTVLPVNGLQLGLLKQASKTNWKNVEPAIFGTLLERALVPEERHALGAHFTPRAYVERLVLPTLVNPLREEWESIRAAAVTLANSGKLKDARHTIEQFHDHLCTVTVLDPACGSGNFLYVALEHLKRLEGEVLDFAAQFGVDMRLDIATHTVDPHQFLGIELNPRAAAIAELVLWIGYLQWHFRTRGQAMPEEPVLKRFKNIECRDAVLAYDGDPQPARDEAGHVITVWDRRSHKTDLVTNRNVPDESKRVPLLIYANPRPASWPSADYIIGNPPFIGKVKLREDLGDGYAETLRAAYPDVPDSADFVLYWWHKAAELVRAGKARRFGLITTNSLRQTFARRVVQHHLSGHGITGGSSGISPAALGTTLASSGTHTAPLGINTEPSGINTLPSGINTMPSSSDTLPSGINTLTSSDDTAPSSSHTAPSGSHTAPSSDDTAPSGSDTLPSGSHTAPSGINTLSSGKGQKRSSTGQKGPKTAEKPLPAPALSLLFAIPDHPWVDSAEGAAVRIAMTVASAGEHPGDLLEVAAEDEIQDDGTATVTFQPAKQGRISADLTVGADVAGAKPLKANEGMTSMGVMLAGRGFVIEDAEAKSLGAGTDESLRDVLRPIRNGRDLLDEPRHMWVIDFTGLTADEARDRYPALYQILLTRVKPEREANRDAQFREKWWLFGRSRPEMRTMTHGLDRYIATVETAKHRLFHFLEAGILSEHRLIVFGSDDAFHLGVLSSRIHVIYSLAAGGTLEDRPVYNKSRCFDPFPFPLCGEAEKARIRDIAEQLDAHRKRVQAQHSHLTLTGLYNVLEKLRAATTAARATSGAHHRGWGGPVVSVATLPSPPANSSQASGLKNDAESPSAPGRDRSAHLPALPTEAPAFTTSAPSATAPSERDGSDGGADAVPVITSGKAPLPEGAEPLAGGAASLSERNHRTHAPDAMRPGGSASSPAPARATSGAHNRAGRGPVVSVATLPSPPDNSSQASGLKPATALTLTDKERRIHDDGLVSVLKQLHDDLDAAVFAAYGWPSDLSDAEILQRLVTLNAQRADEEKRGIIHWLRPDYQRSKEPGGKSTEHGAESTEELPLKAKKAAKPKTNPQSRAPGTKPTKQPWPKSLAERIRAVEQALHTTSPTTAEALSQSFSRAKPTDVQEILESLVALGRARREGERFSV